jgi:cell division protein FtsB
MIQLRALGASWLDMPLRQLGVYAITLVLGILTLSLLFNFIQQVTQSAALEARRAELEAQATALAGENVHLGGIVEYAESDAYVEHTARERLGYAREGDIVLLPDYTAPPQEPGSDLPVPEPDEPEAAPKPPPPEPNWQRWWEAFATTNDHRLIAGN